MESASLQGGRRYNLLVAPWLAHLGVHRQCEGMSAGALPPEFIRGSRRTFSCLAVSQLYACMCLEGVIRESFTCHHEEQYVAMNKPFCSR